MKGLLLGLLLTLAIVGFACGASAQSIPNVRGLQPFVAQTRYMSLVGYMRWQYFTQNNTWISVEEAAELVRTQTEGS
jgi:ribose/xylose/arabinose/galactoside ABC-type transport system permease subunit